MPNNFFDVTYHQEERALLRDLSDEMIAMWGFPVYYIPRTYVATDDVMNEVVTSSFDKKFMLDAMLLDSGGWTQNDLTYSKFGYTYGGPSARFAISRTNFQAEVPNSALKNPNQPNEGDLIYVPHVNQLLEIKADNVPDPFSQSGQVHWFELNLEPFRYSYEGIGVKDVQGDTNMADVLQEFRRALDASVEVTQGTPANYDNVRGDTAGKQAAKDRFGDNKKLRDQTPITQRQDDYGFE